MRVLLELQKTDTAISTRQGRLVEIRGGEELSELREAVAAAEGSWEKLSAELDAARRELKYQEQEADSIRTEIAAQEKRLYGGAVRSPKEATQMQDHIASRRKRVGELEDGALSLMLAIEGQEPAVGTAREDLDAAKGRLAGVEAELAAEAAAIEAELPGLAGRREAQTAELAAGLYTQYETLKGRRGGVAVVALIDGRCEGCRVTMPFMTIREIRGGKVRTCETCGRILVEP